MWKIERPWRLTNPNELGWTLTLAYDRRKHNSNQLKTNNNKKVFIGQISEKAVVDLDMYLLDLLSSI